MLRSTLRNTDRIDAGRRTARLLSRVGAVALVWGLGLVAPAAAEASAQSASVYTLSLGRIGAMVAVVVGLVGAVIGGLAVARSAGIGADNVRRRAILALVLGPIGLVVGALVAATARGGLGTGNGFGGGIVAIMVGLIGMALGGLALARSRRVG